MPKLIPLALAVAAFLSSALVAAAAPAPDRVMLLVKFVPEHGQPADGRVVFEAESCRACIQLHDAAFERFNSRETVLQLEVPRGRFLEIAFRVAPSQARRVIINDSDVSVRREPERVILSLPPLYENAIWAPALETDIVEPGMVLRVEPADPARRAGAYADGRFPALERRAADNLGFAQREVVRMFGLGQQVEAERTGTIMLMGFDTNFPAGHTDAPPHIHMHLRWPNNVGTQISHLYLNSRGLLTENKVGIRAFGAPQQTFGPGQTFWTIDNRGRRVYGHTITPEGHLLIEVPDGGRCLLQPVGAGFDGGVRIDCGLRGATTVAATNDIARGVITVSTGDITETFRYDVDTGALLSPQLAPPSPASARNPEF